MLVAVTMFLQCRPCIASKSNHEEDEDEDDEEEEDHDELRSS